MTSRILATTEAGESRSFKSANAFEAWRTLTRPKGVLRVTVVQIAGEPAASRSPHVGSPAQSSGSAAATPSPAVGPVSAMKEGA